MLKLVTALILVSIAFTCKAQNIQLGFRWESNSLLMHTDGPERRNEYVPDGIQLNAAVFPFNNLGFEARLGAEPFQEFYIGFEYGLLGKYYITRQSLNFYLLGGVMFHHNAGDAHGSFTLAAQTFTLPAFGIGINPAGAFNIEMLFLNGMKQSIAGEWGFSRSSDWVHYTTKLDWVIKIGAGFSWSLF